MGLIVRTLFAICLLTAAWTARAQISNGDFSSGPTAWTWKQALVSDSDCVKALVPFSPRQNQDTPASQYDSARGRFANVTGATSLGVGYWFVCRQIEQSIFVLPGTMLAFESKLGDRFGSTSGDIINQVGLEVVVVGSSEGREEIIFSEVGYSEVCNSDDLCPKFQEHKIDISKYWGRTITLKFRSLSSYSRSNLGTSSTNSSAYVDSIRFVPTIVTSWDLPISGSWYNKGRSGHGLHVSGTGNGKPMPIW